ncbi:hypothetical protein [Marinomonas posidonica]|uniref:hypothetical protein n=1 Tax=Marinomonas posidonica TaxID=936476 RepID=UPI003735E0B0
MKDNNDNSSNNAGQKSKSVLVPFLLCFILSVGASGGISYFLISSSKDDPELDSTLSKYDARITDVQNAQKKYSLQIDKIEKDSEELKLYLRHSSATALKNILINQEENIQSYLKVMKSAMNDLSRITPDSTDWNSQYQYRLDLALKNSLEREDLLRLLKTGEPNEKASQ